MARRGGWKLKFIERNFRPTNFLYWDSDRTEGAYGMPTLEPVDYVPERLLGFNYAKSSQDFSATIHFYLDDYLFERVWQNPDKYMPILSQFRAVMTPNFSIYLDMPEAMKIWNTFRARLLGQMFQDYGMTVIPIVYWSDERSYDWCFDGIPEGGTISVNNIGNWVPAAKDLWHTGIQELIVRKHPNRILLYGNDVHEDFDFGGTEVLYYENSITRRLKNVKRPKQ